MTQGAEPLPPDTAPGSVREQSWFFVARLFPSALGLITTAVLTRIMDPSSYGLYAFGLSIVLLLTNGCFEWLGLSLLRLAPSAQKDSAFFQTIVGCFLIITALAILACAIFADLDGSEISPLFGVACIVAGVLSSWTELKQRLQTAELQRRAYFLTASFRSILSTILVVGAALLHGGALVMLFMLGAANLLTSWFTPEARLALSRPRLDGAVARRLLAFGLPLSISIGLSTVLISIDKWLLQFLSGSDSTGYFTAATLITQVPVLTVASCLAPSSLAMAVRAVEFGGPREAHAQLVQGFTLLLAVVLSSAAGVMLISDDAAQLALGPAYWTHVARLTPWLVGTGVLAAMRAFYVDYAFHLAHKTYVLIWVTALAIVINVALDVLLIPTYAEQGAAMGSFVAYAVSLVTAAAASQRAYRLPLPVQPLLRIVFAVLLMVGTLLNLPHFGPAIDLILRVLVGATVFSAAMVALNVLGMREKLIAMVRELSARWSHQQN